MTSESTTQNQHPTDSSTISDHAKIKIQTVNADPLHGLTLAVLLERLVEIYGWEELARFINIRCFTHDPSIKSSLSFLRRTPWARTQVEDFYVRFGHAEWHRAD